VRGQRQAPAAFTLGKDPVFILQEAGCAPEPVWAGAENLAPPPGFDPRTVQPVANRENMSAQHLKRGNFKSRKYLLSYLLYARKSEGRCEVCVVIRIRPNLVLINLTQFIPLCYVYVSTNRYPSNNEACLLKTQTQLPVLWSIQPFCLYVLTKPEDGPRRAETCSCD